jgi:hypothetical protein
MAAGKPAEYSQRVSSLTNTASLTHIRDYSERMNRTLGTRYRRHPAPAGAYAKKLDILREFSVSSLPISSVETLADKPIYRRRYIPAAVRTGRDRAHGGKGRFESGMFRIDAEK